MWDPGSTDRQRYGRAVVSQQKHLPASISLFAAGTRALAYRDSNSNKLACKDRRRMTLILGFLAVEHETRSSISRDSRDEQSHVTRLRHDVASMWLEKTGLWPGLWHTLLSLSLSLLPPPRCSDIAIIITLFFVDLDRNSPSCSIFNPDCLVAAAATVAGISQGQTLCSNGPAKYLN